jgi:hypothetical protein
VADEPDLLDVFLECLIASGLTGETELQVRTNAFDSRDLG